MRNITIAVTIAAVAMGLAASSRAGEAVVISDSADLGYARGSTMTDGAPVRVPEGKTLTLIDANGKGKTIPGPFDGKLEIGGPSTPIDPSVLNSLKRILDQRTETTVGIVRDASEKPEPPNPRLIDLGDSATFCVPPGQKPELWRPSPLRHTTLTLMQLSAGGRTDVDWPANQATVRWPDGLPIVDGETYQASMPGVTIRPRLLLKVVAFGEPSIAEADRLSQAQCRKQAVTMLETLAGTGARR